LYLPAITSNHNLLFLDTVTPSNNLPRPFRFEEFLTRDPSCSNIISAAWSFYFPGSPAFMLSKKLKATKYALKNWNKFHFGHIQTRISSLTRQLDIVQQSNVSDKSFQAEVSLKQDFLDLAQFFLQE
jgi:hypothetical protein